MKKEQQNINWFEFIALSLAMGVGQFVVDKLTYSVFSGFLMPSLIYALSCLGRGIVMAVGFNVIFKRVGFIRR